MVAANLIRVDKAEDLKTCAQLQREYLDWINKMLEISYGCCLSPSQIQLFGDEVSANWLYYSGDKGRFYFALVDGIAIGMAGIKRVSTEVCELKRLYVSPPYRNAGCGRLLVVRLLDDARTLGYHVVRLETVDFMVAAMRLYESVGFVPIPEFKGSEGRGYAIQGYERYYALEL